MCSEYLRTIIVRDEYNGHTRQIHLVMIKNNVYAVYSGGYYMANSYPPFEPRDLRIETLNYNEKTAH